MPWRCPACRTEIHHHELEEKPRMSERYRCHVCRLELIFNDRINRLVVVPLNSDEADAPGLRPTQSER
jgi:hypothetical protein